MPTELGTASMVSHCNGRGQTIVYCCTAAGQPVALFGNGNRQDGNLLAQYWRQGRYSYAVVSLHRYPGDPHACSRRSSRHAAMPPRWIALDSPDDRWDLRRWRLEGA